QVRILTERFRDTSPTQISRDVRHRCKSPVDALPRRFPCRDARGLPHEFRVPARGLRQGNRKYSSKAMNHILAIENWNAEPAFVGGDLLRLGLLLNGAAVEERSPAPPANLVPGRRWQAARKRCLRHLSELLF